MTGIARNPHHRPIWPQARALGVASIGDRELPLYAPPHDHMAREPWPALGALRAIIGPGSYRVIEGGVGVATVQGEGGIIGIVSPTACRMAAGLASQAGAITPEIEAALCRAVEQEIAS